MDARLTNGADVTVTESPGAARRPRRGRAGSRPCRASAASSRSSTASPTSAPTSRTSTACGPRTIGAAGKLQDAWFQGGSARAADGEARGAGRTRVLVSAETVKDFQLHPGDLLRLRLQDGRTQAASRPCRSTTRASRRSSRPRRPTRSSSPTPATSRRRPAATPSASFLVQTDGTSPGAGRRARARRRRHVGAGHRHPAPAPGRRLEPDRRRAVAA